MSPLKTILVVDDSAVSRKALFDILSPEYDVLEAKNGRAALKILLDRVNDISAILLDLVMPVMDGHDLLKIINSNRRYSNLPIIVITADNSNGNELKALALGAWDYVSKPYNAQVILFRLKNAIDRSGLAALKQLKYLADYDKLMGIYNKTKFFQATRQMLDKSRGERFVFLRFDVDRFQLINSFFGAAEGDKLLIYIASRLAEDARKFPKATFGRIESDIVGLCIPYDKAQTENIVVNAKKTLAKFNPNYDIVPSIGLYVIDDPSISVEEMYNRATLAAKTCKGNYVDFYAYYNESMSVTLAEEQEITNEMNFALENGQFEIYLQPQFNIHTNLPCGAEALVRWNHPKKGLLSPGTFIPVFERNGFITKLDHYVWEEACRCLSAWKARGITPYPISVNISRVNVYNPNLAETLLELVKKYDIEPALLNLELTESAYTDNPVAMKKVMARLQGQGFVLMMDDFGSGYSSLALLKDIMVDVLKIDMLFLSKTEIPGRGENIIASVIRMAKWLNIPVIAEGSEKIEQVDFLRSVGCDYAQGYYFARPMPVAEYEKLCMRFSCDGKFIMEKKSELYRYDDLFSFNSEMKLLFNNALQAAVIYEFSDNHIELIRVNEAYYALLGHDDMLANAPSFLTMVDDGYRAALLNAFQLCAKSREIVECEYLRHRSSGGSMWIYTKLRYASMVGNKHIIIGELTDITMRKALDSELQKYKASWLDRNHDTRTVLIVDDASINRTILKKILQDKFIFLEADNGAAAIEVLKNNLNQVDLILLDISMPVMDGKEFLRYKKKSPELSSIPVIMITVDNSPEQQASTFAMGANDYIVKPFIPAVVIRRVDNVLEANQRFKEMVRAYNTMSAQVKTDLMTGLINRVSAQEMITQALASATGTCVMVMLDIDNFKKINDTYGHDYGDKVICAVAERLRLHFRKEDIIARMGGDEFAVFVKNIPDVKLVEMKARQLCESMLSIKIDGYPSEISCSVGISVSGESDNSFDMLYRNSDKALYNAKCRGRNIVSIFGEENAATSVTKWITDAESVLNSLNDSIYACDRDSYDLIYANDSLCKFAGVTLEECKGRKCYEVLMHKTSPCDFCPLVKISQESVYTRLFKIPNSSQTFLMRGKNINRNGTIVHLEVAVDVTKVENMDTYWNGGGEQ
ncbi:MAG: EAL domain-containing protein [Oscillospiraceae bacterium]